jgi:hypothetical protein
MKVKWKQVGLEDNTGHGFLYKGMESLPHHMMCQMQGTMWKSSVTAVQLKLNGSY